jgi:NAD(P)-dependent dehydrogenase (short-subunit alcohol dehydrogenase family)
MSAVHAPGPRVAVVTGGSAGLGRAIVRELADAGYDIGVLARGPDGLAGTAKDVADRGRRCVVVPTDVADARAVEDAADRVERELGPVDVWVNNAMAGVLAEFLDVTPEEFDRVTAVNYLGTVNGTRAALRRMVPRGRGHVVQISSALAYRGIPLQAAYSGSKHAVVGFTESVRAELRHRRSTVDVSMVHMPALNTIQFSWVRSRMPDHPQPVPPVYQPEVGARAVAHVVAHPRRSVYVGLPTVATVAAGHLVPGLLDRYLARTGYASQQTSRAVHTLGDNLDAPVAGDHGAHGGFDDEAKAYSTQAWATQHRGAVALTGIVATVAGTAAARLWRRLR